MVSDSEVIITDGYECVTTPHNVKHKVILPGAAAARHLLHTKSACPQKSNAVLSLGIILLSVIFLCIFLETWKTDITESAGFTPHTATERAYHMRLVDYVNAPRNGARWRAVYNKFASRGVDEDEEKIEQNELKTRGDNEVLRQHARSTYAVFGDTLAHLRQLAARDDVALPHAFDARVRWPLCASVHRIHNQAGCGSCFVRAGGGVGGATQATAACRLQAVSATSVMSDRVCIGSNGTRQPQISARDLLNCCEHCGTCNGSLWPLFSFTYWRTHGIVTGGAYGSYEGCRPYDKPASCGNPCSADLYYTQPVEKECERKCQPIYDRKYEDDLHRSSSAYWIKPIPHADEYFPEYLKKIKALIGNVTYTTLIKRELLLNGPVMSCFSVYDEFQHYHSGVYTKTSPDTKILYGHCAKLLGWGGEGDSQYWLYANSWGQDFAENGFFRVAIDNLPEEVAAGQL